MFMIVVAAKRNSINGSERVRQLLRYAYSEMYGGEMPEIAKTEKGKPYFPARPEVYFSLSHTDTYVMCAIGDSPVGCDIQSPRQVRAGLAERVCTAEEQERFDFFQLWTLKEAWIKLNGGLDRELREIEFSGSPDSITTPAPAKTARLYKVADCAAAVCARCRSLPEDVQIIDL